MRNYRIVKSKNGWEIQKKLPENLMNYKIVYDVIASGISDYCEAEKRAKNMAYSELAIGDIAEEF